MRLVVGLVGCFFLHVFEVVSCLFGSLFIRLVVESEGCLFGWLLIWSDINFVVCRAGWLFMYLIVFLIVFWFVVDLVRFLFGCLLIGLVVDLVGY